MPRPPLPPGVHGTIRTRKIADKTWVSYTYYRDYDGKRRLVERRGTTKGAAELNLQKHLQNRGRIIADSDITGDTLVSKLGDLYMSEVDKMVAENRRSPTTADGYRYRYERHIKDGIGELRIREVSVSRLDKLVQSVKEHFGVAGARTTRTVLSGMFGLAVRYDALDRNPVREVARIEGDSKSPARALTLEEAQDLRAKIHASEKACTWDLLDFTDMMLVTGLRIGETSAITWDALDLDAMTVEVRGTVIRIKGQGLIIKWRPKSKSGYRTLELPTWMVEKLKARRQSAKQNAWDAVFTAPAGGLRDPSNTQADLRVIFEDAGYDWVTSHVYRKTLATRMDDAGLSPRAAADQLGHAHVSMTQNHYFGRKVAKTGAAALMEGIGAGD